MTIHDGVQTLGLGKTRWYWYNGVCLIVTIKKVRLSRAARSIRGFLTSQRYGLNKDTLIASFALYSEIKDVDGNYLFINQRKREGAIH